VASIDLTSAPQDTAQAHDTIPTQDIDTLRGQIDALDTAIARLIAERVQLSRRIQTARLNAGGTRIELGRERAIIDHYRSSLGTEGASVGEAVLRASRGVR
jgi:chorismate mutase